MIKKNGESGPQAARFEAAVYEINYSCPEPGCGKLTSRYAFKAGQPHFVEHRVFHCLLHKLALQASAPRKVEAPRIVAPNFVGARGLQ